MHMRRFKSVDQSTACMLLGYGWVEAGLGTTPAPKQPLSPSRDTVYDCVETGIWLQSLWCQGVPFLAGTSVKQERTQNIKHIARKPMHVSV